MSFSIKYNCVCVRGFSLIESYLGFEEWYSLLGSINDSTHKLIFEVLYYTGCSESELINLKFSDFNFKSSSIKFKDRISAIPLQLSLKIKKINLKPADHIFSSRQSSRISSKRIQQIVSEISLRNIGKRITPQDIRTLHVCHALVKSQSIISISKQTGLKAQRIAQITEAYRDVLNRIAVRYEL